VTHLPVLLEETIRVLAPERGGKFVDGTAGGGGHAARLLEASGSVELLALDRDEEAVARVSERLRPFRARAHVVHASFDQWRAEAARLGWSNIDGILLDLGFSSYQMDTAERGFSFLREGPLDMRMDRTRGVTAAQLVNELDERELVELFRSYGEDPDARRIARAIVASRPLLTTRALADVVVNAVPARRRREAIHPATLVFQALRIKVNDELGMLERVLSDLPEGLADGARIAVISFHSLEDRMVKRRFRELSRGCTCPPDFPVCVCSNKPILRDISRRAIKPSEEEVRANPRSRSARLRAAVKESA
jgi:16S rRNA (cytosine1402-N4)-methyltransferase